MIYDVHPDGKRIATLAAQGQSGRSADKVIFILNFFDELRRVLPEK